MIKPKNEYRIVRDRHLGYEVQIRKWWLPFSWCQVGINTHSTLKDAERFANEHSTQSHIKYLGKLPIEGE